MSGTSRRIFVCTNKRRTGLSCGARCDTAEIADHVKRRLQERPSSADPVQLRTTKCLGRCLDGPVLAILPEKVWYRYADKADIDEVLSTHIDGGRMVERLLVRAPRADD